MGWIKGGNKIIQSDTIRNFEIEEKAKIQRAKFGKDNQHIIDSDGNEVAINDERVVIVAPSPENPYGKRLIEHLYRIHGRTIRIADEITPDIIQYSKKLCSGRECFPSVAIAGAVLKDIAEYKTENEITIYRNPLNQHGPCQNGNWPLLWQNFTERLNVKNAIFGVSPSKRNNYLGLSFRFRILEAKLSLIGHYLTEARNALQCAAENRDSALDTFEEVTDQFIQHVRDDKTLKAGLKEWAKEVSKIPLDKSISKIPKILIIGGLNLLFCHYPVEEYFLEQGISPKVVDPSETVEMLLAERAIRHGFKRGCMKPQQQLNLKNILLSFLNRNFKNTKDALISMRRVYAYHRKSHQYRKIIGKSGLLFDESPSYVSLLTNSYEFVSHNGFTEASTVTGRFQHSVKSRVYDGIINLGCFNCSPAMNSQAIIRPLANKTNIAYSALDVEGPFISTNQRRLLETIVIQAKRIRKNKNANRH